MQNKAEKFVEMFAVTAELMGVKLSPIALVVMAKDFEDIDFNVMQLALKNVRTNHSRFSQAAINAEVEKLNPDGRLGADEAWALIPHDEASSAVITDEMAEALGIARPLLNEGDKIAARMAFKQAYESIIQKNKMLGVKPKWFASLGHDPNGRELAMNYAVEKGRLTQEHAQSLLPSPKNTILDEIAGLLVNKAEEMTEDRIQKQKERLAELRKKMGWEK